MSSKLSLPATTKLLRSALDSLRGRLYEALAIPYIRPNAPIIVIIGGAKLLDIDTGRPAAVDWETSVLNIFRGSIIFPPGSVLPLSFLCHLMAQKTHAVSERPINSASGRTDGEIGK